VRIRTAPADGGGDVAERTYGLTEVVGTSKLGVDEAIRNGVRRLSRTVEHLDWFEVTQVRGYIRDGEVDHFQVTMKIGSRLEDA
jgi:flavin-binding protein dodecin